MTVDEFAEIAYLLKNGWPGQFSEDNEAAYGMFLLRYDVEVVRAALHKLTFDGAKFLPSVGEVVATLRKLVEPPRPSWTEAWATIQRRMMDRRGEPAADERVEAFVQQEGLQRLRATPFFDPDRGELRVHQLRTRWDEFVDTREARRSRELALGASGPQIESRTRLLEQSIELGS